MFGMHIQVPLRIKFWLNHLFIIWLVVASGRTRRLVISCVFCVKWVRWGVGGWGVGGWGGC